jgi:hypothetical protein
MSGGRRLWCYLACAAVAASLAACGGSTPSQPNPTPTPVPTPPPPQVVAQGSGPLTAESIGQIPPFTTARAGALEATVDWTYATNDIDVYLVRGDCSGDQFLALQCTIAAFSESTTAKPEKIRADNAAAGTYSLFIANIGKSDERLSFQVVLTPSATGAAPPSASSAGIAPAPSLGQKRTPHGVVDLH